MDRIWIDVQSVKFDPRTPLIESSMAYHNGTQTSGTYVQQP